MRIRYFPEFRVASPKSITKEARTSKRSVAGVWGTDSSFPSAFLTRLRFEAMSSRSSQRDITWSWQAPVRCGLPCVHPEGNASDGSWSASTARRWVMKRLSCSIFSGTTHTAFSRTPFSKAAKAASAKSW